MAYFKSLRGKVLSAVRIGRNHQKVHPAWQDDTNEGFLICYDLNLEFEDKTVLSVQPCEVEISGRYPSLGLVLEDVEAASFPERFEVSCLPMRVEKVIQTDYLGEDANNQFDLVLEDGSKIVIRHVFPPMTMGIKLEGHDA